MFSRSYGGLLQDLDHLPDVSLGYREFGKVKVDCRFRLRKSKWGVFGQKKEPVGVLYMDLVFDQPKDFRLKNATVLVTLKCMKYNRPSSLYITDYYGPKQLYGSPTEVNSKEVYHITPQADVFGNSFGGIGLDKEKTFSYSRHWSFTGELLPGDSSEVAYRTLKWELTENELDRQPSHNNKIHTAFAFCHDYKEFLIIVDIHGKLQRTRDRLRTLVGCFPPPNRNDQGVVKTLVNPGKRGGLKASLDKIVHGLQGAMELENQMAIPVQMPSSLPVTFQDVTPAALDTGIRSELVENHSVNRLNLPAIPKEKHLQSRQLVSNVRPKPELDTCMAGLRQAVEFYSSASHKGHDVSKSTASDTDLIDSSVPEDRRKLSESNGSMDGGSTSDGTVYIKVSKITPFLFLIQLLVTLINMMSMKSSLNLILPDSVDAPGVSSGARSSINAEQGNESELQSIDGGVKSTKLQPIY